MANLARIARVMTSKRIRYISLGAALALGALNCAEAGTINSASAALGDVTAAIALASDGDTVVIPPGTASWTSTLTITKGITLQGATTVSGDHNTTLAGTPMSANDHTIITNNVPQVGNVNRLIIVTLTATQSFRMSGITFRQGTTGAGNNGQVAISGTSQSVRIDHCHNFLGGVIFQFYGWCYGVIDHCILDFSGSDQILVGMDSYGGGSNVWGDGSWADGPNFGTNQFIFFEDNTFNNNGGTTAGLIDATPGGRYVQRYNVLNGVLMGGGHGTETIQRGRRSSEFYGNIIYPTSNCCSGGWAHQVRSGTLLSYNNTWITSNSTLVGGKGLQVYRRYSTGYSPWGSGTGGATASGAYGANPWDANDTEGNGTYVAGHSPHVYYSGTVTQTNTNGLLADSNANWKPNQWVGYHVIDTSNNSIGDITANTNNTITCTTGGVATPTFNSGNGYQIHRLLVPLDGIGRGKGDLVKRVTNPAGGTMLPTNTVTNTVSWPRNALEPIYCWDSYNGQPVRVHPIGSQGGTIAENRDYYNLNTTWSVGNPLATGVAVGRLTDRPTQCTPGTDITGVTSNPPGVAYWATDTGPANQNGSVSGTLYVCTSTNTWTPYYTPYQYPHSLVSGASSGPTPPSAPQNLHVVGP